MTIARHTMTLDESLTQRGLYSVRECAQGVMTDTLPPVWHHGVLAGLPGHRISSVTLPRKLGGDDVLVLDDVIPDPMLVVRELSDETPSEWASRR